MNADRAFLDRTSAAKLVDLTRYPIDDLGSAEGRRLVDACRADLEEKGACRLPGFLTAEATEALADEARELAGAAYHQDDTHNVYFEDIDDSLPDDDPRRLLQHTSGAAVAWDLIPPDAKVREFYEWDPLLAFIGAALNKDPLYRNADPLGACNYVFYREGDELGWHFDRAEFAVTLMLQKAEEGGDFEYVPWIRSADDESYAAVQRLLLGSLDDVVHFPSDAGTLAFFRGQRSIHRVTPIQGERLRINTVLAYAEEPGAKLNEYTQKLFYGRTA